MNAILITGGAGFIGSNFVYYWRRKHPADRLVVLDALTYAGNLRNIEPLADDPMVRFVKGDVSDWDLVSRLFSEHDFDKVVHFAAETHVDRSIATPDAFIRTNVVGTGVLLRVALDAWDKTFARRRFHHISTDEVYGSLGPDDAASTEATRYAPRSPYSASKAASDHLVRSFHHTYGLPVTITNCSNNYGPYQFPEKLIPLMLIAALEGRQLPVYGDGLHVRDWLHVSDHCAAIDAVLESGRPGETYNVGGGNQVANIDLVRRVCQLLNAKISENPRLRASFPASPAASGGDCCDLISHVVDRPGHDRRYALSTLKIEKELGFQPSHQFDRGLDATVDWYLVQANWWKSLQNSGFRGWLAVQYGWQELAGTGLTPRPIC